MRKLISKLLGTPSITPNIQCKALTAEREIIRANGKRELRIGYYNRNIFKHIFFNIKLAIQEMRAKRNGDSNSC